MSALTTDIVQAIKRRLDAATFFSTAPAIPVLSIDQKDVNTAIINASKSTGAFVLVDVSGGESESSDTPGPYFDQGNFLITVSELVPVWRSKSGSTPGAHEICEAVCRLLHHQKALDASNNPVSGGVFIVESFSQQQNESFNQFQINVSIPLGLPTSAPTR
jgi:hypothetical protein